jgi:hypothetical protein
MEVESNDKEISVCICNKCGNYEEIPNSSIAAGDILCRYIKVIYDNGEVEEYMSDTAIMVN